MTSPSIVNPAFNEGPVIEVQDTGVIWSAIIGGAIAATAFLLLMAPLGSGLGFLGTSPWQAMDTPEKTFTLMSAVWLILMQWVSSGIGGYLTGRLRTGWVGAHTHEVFFRDTAHGFLTWALTTVVTVGLLAAGMMHAAERHTHGMTAGNFSPQAYAVNRLFRTDQPTTNVTEQDREDASLILMQAAENENMADADRLYLEQLVEARTDMRPVEAHKRVEDTVAQLRETEHTIHKAMAVVGIFVFLSMWIGAFIASAAGALGGLHRDLHYKTGRLSPN